MGEVSGGRTATLCPAAGPDARFGEPSADARRTGPCEPETRGEIGGGPARIATAIGEEALKRCIPETVNSCKSTS